jgi:phosphoadenosine phosphosulfate reductase
MITRKKDTAQVFATESVRVRASSKSDAGKLLKDTENSIRRPLGCMLKKVDIIKEEDIHFSVWN